MRIYRSIATVVICFLLGAQAWAVDAPGRAVPPPLPARVAKPAALTQDQRQAHVQARTGGIKVEQDERVGAPRSIRGQDLGLRRSFSGGKGLKAQGRSSAEDAVAVLDNLSRVYGFKDAAQEFTHRRTEADKLGFRHVRLMQMHRGLRVVGGDLIVHFDGKQRAYEVNGRYMAGVDVPAEAKVTAAAAEAVARKDLAAFSAGAAELVAVPVLVVYAIDGTPCLAYEFALAQPAASARWRYWVEATTGEVLRRYDEVMHIGVPTVNGVQTNLAGNVLTGEGGERVTVTGWRENATSLYYLHNPGHHWQIHNVAASGSWPDLNTYAYRATPDWGASDRAELSLAAGFDTIQNYWRNVHARDSFNGAGTMAFANVHEGVNYVNAFYDGYDFHFGDGDNLNAASLAVLDVAAHEFAHGVTDYSAGLMYADESGALNESFSDIFGACVEFHAQPDGRMNYPGKVAGTADWLLGEDCWLGSTALRDMRNPRNPSTVGAGNEQPSRYRGSFWYDGAGDNGGVHYNSGVQNFFFYLLCEGGSGNNDGLAYTVAGIGLTNAEQVAYRALTVYGTPGTDYRGVRAAWLSAAADLNPAWVDSVAAAWNACGVSSLSLTPESLSFRGYEGGPFAPESSILTLSNVDPVTMSWTVTASEPWVTVSPTGGSLAGSGAADVTVIINPAAGALVAGTYTATLAFSNTVDATIMNMPVRLLVGASDYFTEQFTAGDNDLDHMTLTFTPNGLASGYAVGRTAGVSAFPTDPAGGVALVLPDDGFARVDLADDARVSLYGMTTNGFFVGANGYITFGRGDTTYAESPAAHFSLPRISALFDDLAPAAGQVTWKQLADRVAVTWQDVPEFGLTTTNNFQIELFFDGRIRMTWLDVAATDGLAGLSRGQDLSADFVESDLSRYNEALPSDDLQVLTYGNLIGNGFQGGPFTSANKTYAITNTGVTAVHWAAVPSVSWLTATPASGTLNAGQATTIVVAFGGNATSLTAGVYDGQVSISNIVTAVAVTRLAQLTVKYNPGEIEVRDSLGSATDLTMPFGEVILGASRTASITITNRSSLWPLRIDSVGVYAASPAAVAPVDGNVTQPVAPPSIVKCYGVDLLSQRLVSFTTDHPDQLTTIASVPEGLYGVDFLNGDFSTLYALNNTTKTLMAITVSNGAQRVVGNCSPVSGEIWTGLAAAPNGTLYASTVNTLYRVDPLTGTATRIGSITGVGGVLCLAANREGQLYGIDAGVMTYPLVRINPATGAGTVIGPLGIRPNNAQGMDFDEITDTLYWAVHPLTGTPELRVIDTTTGAARLVGAFPSGVELEMAVAAALREYELLDTPSQPFTIPAGGAATVQVRYTPLTVRTNNSVVIIRSDDLSEPEVRVALSGSGVADALRVFSEEPFAASGHPGGPFTPPSFNYTVSNAGPSQVDWSVGGTGTWVSVAPAGGTLAGGASVNVEVSFNANADSLGVGTNMDQLIFSNRTTSIGSVTRAVTLRVFTSPQMTVAPAAIAVTNTFGGTTQVTVTVSNLGAGDAALSFQVSAYEKSRTLRVTPAVGSRLPAYVHDFTKIPEGAIFTEQRLLVRLAEGVDAGQRAALLAGCGGAMVEKEYEVVSGLIRVRLPAGQTVAQALLLYNGNPAVRYAEPDYTYQALTIPNDPMFARQWSLHNEGQMGGTPDVDIDAPEAWSQAIGGTNILVAVLDSGVDYNHEDLASNMWVNTGEIPDDGKDNDGNGYVDDVHGFNTYNDNSSVMDDHGHGTHVASIIGAVGNNGIGLAGVNWRVKIVPVKFLNFAGNGGVSDCVEGMQYARKVGAKVVLNAFGNYDYAGAYMQSVKDAIESCKTAGMLFVMAAGNTNENIDLTMPLESMSYPARYDCDNIISVLATDTNDAMAAFSAYGNVSIDLGAPGVNIPGCKPNNLYINRDGTSMAAAHVAGACALLMAANPDLTWADVKQVLMDSVDPTLPGLCVSGGRLNLRRALSMGAPRWLTASPGAATNIVPGASVTVTVGFSAVNVEPGSYTGEVVVAGNDEASPSVTVPVAMTVLPDGLWLTPNTNFISSGMRGGPFAPSFQSYTLTNWTASAFDWSVTHTSTWLGVSTVGGLLGAGFALVVTARVTEAACALNPGEYRDVLVFTNHVSGATQLRPVRLVVTNAPQMVIFSEPCNTDPGWGREAQWQFGVPLGVDGDPTTGHTGTNVFGYNLAGRYADNIPAYYLTTPAINCSGYQNVNVDFWRWLNCGLSVGHSGNCVGVQVSNNGVDWSVVWDNDNIPGSGFHEAQWTSVNYDISSIADNQPTVYIRWAMGPIGATWEGIMHGGWNLDDIRLTADLIDPVRILPAIGVTAHRYAGGPIVPAGTTYELRNLGTLPVNWTAGTSATWMTVTPPGGTLAGGATATVTVAYSAGVDALGIGTYEDDVSFMNENSGLTVTRRVQLVVDAVPGEIAVSDSVAPSTDLKVAFSNVIAGLSRVETVTISNLHPTQDLVLTNLGIGVASGVSGFSGAVQGVAPSIVPMFGIQELAPFAPFDVLVSFMSPSAGTQKGIFGVSRRSGGMDFVKGDFSKVYSLNYYSNSLVTFDTVSGAEKKIGACAPTAKHVWSGLTASPGSVTLYASAISTNQLPSRLYKVNATNASVTLVGVISNFYGVAGLAMNLAGELYGVDIVSDTLIKIDPATAVASGVGPLGFDASDDQGLDFDEVNNILYWSAFSTEAGTELRVIDTATGASTLVASVPPTAYGSFPMEMAVAAGGGSPFSVTNAPLLPCRIAAGQTLELAVRYAPQDTASHKAFLAIASTDVDEPVVEVELTGSGVRDALRVSPVGDGNASGHRGGPFAPASFTYAVSNAGPTALTWAAGHAADWMSLSSGGGTLASGAAVNVTAAFTASASLLATGTYTDVIAFSNVTSTVAPTLRGIHLSVYTRPSLQVSPLSMTVTNRMGHFAKRAMTVGNAASADARLDVVLDAYETGRSTGTGFSAVDAALRADPLAVAAAAAAGFRPPAGRDFTLVQPGAAFTAGRLLVRFAPEATALQRTAALEAAGGGAITHAYRIVPGLCIVELPQGTPVEAALRTFNSQPTILYAEPDYEVRASTMPNDPRFGELWGMNNIGQIIQGGTVTAGTNTVSASPMTYSPATAPSGVTGILYDCGMGKTGEFPAVVSNNIALILRGDTTFAEKASLAKAAGAKAMIVYNNVSGALAGTLGSVSNWIPSVGVSDTDGALLRACTNTQVTVTITTSLPDSDIDAPEAWSTATGSRSVIVGVIDTGVDYNHEDLAANIWVNPGEIPDNGLDDDGNGFVDDVHGYDFVNNDGDPMDDHDSIYHGTHCSGTIGAVGNNGIGVAGVCWKVKIMALKFLDATGSGSVSAAVRAVEYATQMGAKLTSNSWGGGGYDQSLVDAVNAADAAGIAFIAAAGNSALDTDITMNYPSGLPCKNVISVLATDSRDELASFSNYGLTTTDLAAPGVSILSCKRGNLYQLLSGTSMATPHVAGAYALLMSANPMLTVAQAKAALMDTADPVPALTGKCITGGRMNVAAALTRAGSAWLTVDPGSAGGLAPGENVNVTALLDAGRLQAGSYTGAVEVTGNDPTALPIAVRAVMVVLPDELRITPASAFTVSGLPGGPFAPSVQIYSLTNTGVADLTWSLTQTNTWLTVAPTVGALSPGQSQTVTAQVNETVGTLPIGVYDEVLAFSNEVSGIVTLRQASLAVQDPNATLTVLAGTGGTTEPSGAITVPRGQATDIAAMPNAGYTFANWRITNGTAVIANTNAASTTVVITNEATIQARFAMNAVAILRSVTATNVPEGGTTAFQLRLSAQPTGTVTVAVARTGGDTNITIQTGSSLSFTTNNWATNQTVTLAASQDADTLNGSATITCSAPGLTSVILTATEQDNDATLTIVAGGGGSTVPNGSVVVTQGVAVVIHAAANSGYGFTNWTVTSGAATITDSHAADTTVMITNAATVRAQFVAQGLALLTSASFVSVPEGGTARFQVGLTEQPASNVTVTVVRSAGDTDLAVQAGSNLVFTTANWSQWQSVTLAAVVDADTLKGSATITCSAVGLANVVVTASELENGTASVDTDGDGVSDAREVEMGRNPLVRETGSVLPFVERFEADTVMLGELTGQHGWVASLVGAAQVQADDVVEGVQALRINSTGSVAAVSQAFTGTLQTVWLDLRQKVSPMAMPASVPNAALALIFNSAGQLVVCDGARPAGSEWTVLTNHPALTTGAWVRISARLDYAKQTWDLYLDGSCVASALGFTAPKQRFACLTFEGKSGAVDDLNAGYALPAGITIPDSWYLEYFGHLGYGDDDDPDGDHLTNREEYLAGTNPNDPASRLSLDGAERDSALADSFIVRWQSATGRVYTVQAATNLGTGFTFDLRNNIPATPPVNVHTDAVNGAGQKFYRVKVE